MATKSRQPMTADKAGLSEKDQEKLSDILDKMDGGCCGGGNCGGAGGGCSGNCSGREKNLTAGQGGCGGDRRCGH